MSQIPTNPDIPAVPVIPDGSIIVVNPRPVRIEVFPVSEKYSTPDEILTLLADRFHIGEFVTRASVLAHTSGCFDIACDFRLDHDEAPLFVWRQK